ncbi:MAG: nuclear transport factor 2 family protein [Desulfovibrio sp.]|jgi:ketosteroid isomerase-like protein|nr:nuclear transport factor 2 family protein [Desulfovibrio sp.]
MKKILLALALLFMTAGTPLASTSEEKAVGDAVEALRKAILSAQRADLEKLVLPTLTYAHSTGRTESMKQFVDNLVNKGTVFKELAFSQMTISVDGDVAVVRHMLDSDHIAGGKPVKGHFMVLLVYKKVKKDWKLFARQGFAAPPKP